MLTIPNIEIPIVEIPIKKDIILCLKREDLIHPEISGNKFWKLFYNINTYLESAPKLPMLITFGGAYSNHISAVSYLGKLLDIKTMGVIRGEEFQENILDNPTLSLAKTNGMSLSFVSREAYRGKLQLKESLKNEFPDALIIEEGGTNALAVMGIQHMLNIDTKDFHYLCSAVGTGGTLAGLSKYCEKSQKVIGFKTVHDESIATKIKRLSHKNNFSLLEPTERYGKITEDDVRFINWFYDFYKIPLDPIYTGKMMRRLFQLIMDGYFAEGSRILAFHTGGLQGVKGANKVLKKKHKTLIMFGLE